MAGYRAMVLDKETLGACIHHLAQLHTRHYSSAPASGSFLQSTEMIEKEGISLRDEE
jgi:hypothetical protein